MNMLTCKNMNREEKKEYGEQQHPKYSESSSILAEKKMLNGNVMTI